MGGTATRSRIDVLLEDESGTARTAAAATFGVPFPEGSLFDPARIRLLDREGRRLPAQFMATAFWRDDSIKWCRCDVTLPVLAGAREQLVVEFGTEVPADAGDSQLHLSADADALTVVTGPLKAVLDKRRFRGLGTVWVDPTGTGRFDDTTLRFSADRAGVVLLDDKGTAFTSAGTPPRRLTVEMNGPSVAIVKVEGDYADASGHPTMSYIARLTFRAGSSRVDLAWTHVNTCTQTEFTDITSLALAGVVPAASNGDVFAPGAAAGAIEAIPSPVRLLQTDERTCTANGASAGGPSGRAPGVARMRNPAGGVALVLHEFWEHWPKALALEGDSLRIEWLPELPGPDFGRGLPHYLMVPFVEGKYRLKWGMSFTETVTLDFGGTLAPEELVAEARHPLVAVIPGEWYARTRALGPLAAPFGRQFKLWDDYVEKGFEAHMARKETFREYGFLNHGDWYGERGRNWGNNEYDFAHGLMLQFARTGRTKYFRLARAAARHQANVDIVHAYPDPFFVGANHQHSIGHTGTWTQTVQRATWSHRYDAHTDASNGHTWAAGMLDAWHLSGDPRTMDAALALGEHIAWAMSPAFDHLGSHERSAGWSLVAIMALYRATYDPLYLAAAARIAEVALREHKPDDGGAWPHLLPIDHAGGHRGARGNNLFLIGILVAGLADYHAETGDERVRKAVVDATRWIAASWDQAAAGWPYSAAPDGKPFYKAGTGLNMLVCPGVMAAATLTGEAQFADMVEAAVESTCRGGPQAIGKELAQKMVFAHGTLAGLQAWAATRRPDKGAGLLDGEGLDRYLLRTPTATGLRVRGPDEKVFHVRLSAPAAELRARRAPHGAKPKDWPTGTLAVVAEDGQVVATDEFSTDGEHVYSCALNGTPGETVYRVVIRDDMRGTWDLDGDGLQVVAETVEGFSIGGGGRARFHVFVPPGTTTFAVDLVGLHTGPYGAAAIAPDNRLAAFHESTNPGQARLPWASAEKDAETTQHPERGVLEISVEPGQAGKVWALVLWGAGDLACKLRGIPPFLATTPDDCFAPRAAGRAP
ncbi:MAG: hypothetical protein GX595_03750 [Lentisphaerae bacterium]|nr:hypothetical protein [Lentisphaerota bacterium]